MKNRITSLFGIQYPIIQAGMVWCSGWRLASAVSQAGGLGIIGAGSMYPEVLKTHIQRYKAASSRPFAVNIPLLYPEIEKLIAIILTEEVPIVFTSAGNPKTWTPTLKEAGRTVVHVVSSTKFARKAEQAGVDAVVAEGFEAGGHNGREETTTFCLVPAVAEAVAIPVIAAGGIGSGRAMLAAFALGAEGVQVGSRFAASVESSAHETFKQAVVGADEGDTVLTLKKLTPVRMLKNAFFQQVQRAEQEGADTPTLRQLLGRGRSKKGIFEGELEEGELEIGQISAHIKQVQPAAEILQDIWTTFEEQRSALVRLERSFGSSERS